MGGLADEKEVAAELKGRDKQCRAPGQAHSCPAEQATGRQVLGAGEGGRSHHGHALEGLIGCS